MISGKEAESFGLVNRSYPLAELMDRAMGLAKAIASKGTIAIAHAIAAVNASDDLGIEEGGAYEAELFGKTFETYDKKEGVAAFLEKRTPNFQNR